MGNVGSDSHGEGVAYPLILCLNLLLVSSSEWLWAGCKVKDSEQTSVGISGGLRIGPRRSHSCGSLRAVGQVRVRRANAALEEPEH